MTRIGRGADAALLALAAVLPFETTRAAFSLGGVGFTSVEVMLCITLATGVVALAGDAERRAHLRASIPWSWVVLLGAFAISALVSALAAPAFEATALKATARTWAGLALVVVTVGGVRTRRDLAGVAAAITAGAAASALIGLAEIVSGTRFGWLGWFRVDETVVGTIRRLSGTFDHANMAAMALEASMPLLAALVWIAWRRQRTLLSAAGLALLVVLLEALVLTYSRAGIASLIASNLIVAALVLAGRRRPVRRAAAPAAALAALAVVFVGINFAASSTVRAGVRHDADQARYNAESRAKALPVVRRDELWRAAIDLVRERPLLGFGLDTFRLSYGPEIGLRRWDRRQHSNSLYVETLVSLGIVGSLAFFGWLVVLAFDITRALLSSATVWQAALAASLLAYLAHGFFDYFLLFSTTGLLFWLLSGLWLAARRAPA